MKYEPPSRTDIAQTAVAFFPLHRDGKANEGALSVSVRQIAGGTLVSTRVSPDAPARTQRVGYVIDAIRKLDARGAKRLDVKRSVMDEYNRWLQRDLAKSVWAADKQSWYKLADGTITNNWPHSTIRYQRLLREAKLEDYDT